jgi:hypothetical protein
MDEFEQYKEYLRQHSGFVAEWKKKVTEINIMKHKKIE